MTYCQQCGKRLEGSLCRRCRLDWEVASSSAAAPICSIQDLADKKTWSGGGYCGEGYYKMKFISLHGEKLLASVSVDFPYGGGGKGFAVVTCDGFGYQHDYFTTEDEAKAALYPDTSQMPDQCKLLGY